MGGRYCYCSLAAAYRGGTCPGRFFERSIMRVLFIYVAGLCEEPYLYLEHKMNPAEFYLPKLGILSLAASLRKAFPHGVYKVLDILNPPHRAMPEDQLEHWVVHPLGKAELYEQIAAFSPDLVGLSCLSTHAQHLPAVVRIVKEAKGDAVCVLGGPYATCSPQQAIRTAGIDFILRGEADLTICDLVKSIWQGGEWQEVWGIGFLDQGNPELTPLPDFIGNLDELPYPAWDLCNLPHYARVHRYLGSGIQHGETANYANIMSSRGCPYQCLFCHKIFGAKFRYRSAHNIADEMLMLHDDYRVEEFTFSDDVFNFNSARIRELCELLIRANRKIKLGFITNGLRGDILSDQLIDILYAAGMRNAAVAVEFASPRIQEKSKKRLNLEKTRQSIEYMCHKGVYVATYNMIGFPGETKAEIKMTLDFNLSLPHHLLIAHNLTIHTGTKLFDWLNDQGYLLSDETVGKLYWHPDEKDDNFRGTSALYLQIMLVKFITEFHFSQKRLQINLDLMKLYADVPAFISSLQRYYRNTWQIYGKALPGQRQQELSGLLQKIYNFNNAPREYGQSRGQSGKLKRKTHQYKD